MNGRETFTDTVLPIISYGSIIILSIFVHWIVLHKMRSVSINKKQATLTWLVMTLLEVATLVYIFHPKQDY